MLKRSYLKSTLQVVSDYAPSVSGLCIVATFIKIFDIVEFCLVKCKGQQCWSQSSLCCGCYKNNF
jgi:hypothetical protein